MKETCGCCKGLEIVTPKTISNRPGQSSLMCRVGTHASFMETMKARLSSLKGLTVRSDDDPSIALMDAWAMVADVLTFYQERIANEGYLRTATERRSILELGRLVGYSLRPGVSSSVYLAYTLDNGYTVEIQKGLGSKSIPDPGEMTQTFENSEALMAHYDLNTMRPRMNRPLFINEDNATTLDTIYFNGISTNLKVNDRLLLVFNNEPKGQWITPVRRVEQVDPMPGEKKTKVRLQVNPTGVAAKAGVKASGGVASDEDDLTTLVKSLMKPPSIQPASSTAFKRDVAQIFGAKSDVGPSLLAAMNPILGDNLYTALSNATVTEPSKLQSVNALRVKAMPFGHNAPLKPIFDKKGAVVGQEEWPLVSDIRLISVKLTSQKLTNDFASAKASRSVSPKGPQPTFVQAKISYGLAPKASKIFIPLYRCDIPVTLGNIKIDVKVLIDIDSCCKPKQETYIFNFKDPQKGNIELIRIIYDIKKSIVTINFGEGPNVSIPPVTLSPGKTERPASANQKVEASYMTGSVSFISISDELLVASDAKSSLFLDAQYDKIIPGSFVLIERPNPDTSNLESETQVLRVKDVGTVTKTDYGMTATVTKLTLEGDPLGKNPTGDWLNEKDRSISVLRNTMVYAQSEPLELADEQIDPVKESIKRGEIELDRLYAGIEAGRWVIVSGERLDVPGTSGVKSSELVMISGVRQDVALVKSSSQGKEQELPLPGDKTHTFIKIAENGLAYDYKRDTVTIYGNVVKATHGETKNEILGSGDSSKAFQKLTLHQSPLTFVASDTPVGAESTLKVKVNDILWHEISSLLEAGPKDRSYITLTDDDNKTTVVFGDGKRGALPPTGVENIKAVYRVGIGSGGNVKAEQVSQLAARPLGVKAVINPIRASGGADREGISSARRNTPLALKALSRLVSVQDYADFANAFTGIGKANAKRLSDGHRLVIHVTIAGEADIPIDKNSDLFRNLLSALLDFGDINQPVQLGIRELMLIILKAKVKLDADYSWESVEPKIRSALLEAFSFENRDFGQDVLLSEVISVMQSIDGVAYVDIDILDSVSDKSTSVEDLMNLYEKKLSDPSQPKQRVVVETARIKTETTKQCSDSSICPAQLAILSPEIRDTIILEIKDD